MFLMIKNSDKKFYFGLADTLLKERYRNHTRDFKHKQYQNCTKLAKYIWQLKRSNINFSIKYSIASKVSANPSSIICTSWITEKLGIIKFINNKDLQNKINKRGYLNKFLLANVNYR